MKTRFLFFVLLIFVFTGCGSKEIVRVELKDFIRRPGEYPKESSLLIATVPDVIKNTNACLDRNVEVTAPVESYGMIGFWTWHMMLAQDGVRIRCYAEDYRLSVDRRALALIQQSQSEKGALTVVGTLRRDGIDIELILYKNRVVLPDFNAADLPLY